MSVPDDPWAPPPEAVQQRAGWYAYPDAPRGWRPSGWGPWPEWPQGPRPSDQPVVRAGVALMAAMTLTGAALWALTRAAAVRIAADIKEFRFGVEVPFATRWGPPVAAVLLVVLAAAAWVVLARLARRHPSGSALTPWFLAGWFLAVTAGFVLGHVVVGAFHDVTWGGR